MKLPNVTATAVASVWATVGLVSSSLALDPPYVCTEDEMEQFPATCKLMSMDKADVVEQLSNMHMFQVNSYDREGEGIDFETDVNYSADMRLRRMDSVNYDRSSGTTSSDSNGKVRSNSDSNQPEKVRGSSSLPVVTAHGIGDSCFNEGFTDFTEQIGDYLQTYSVCIPTGETREEDVYNSFFMGMEKSVDVFAENILKDPQLQGGFHAIGVSQGNILIRGYIIKYIHKEGYPKVHTYMSISGVNAGVGAFPYCGPDEDGNFTDVCGSLNEFITDIYYLDMFQDNILPAGYWREPNATETEEYRNNCTLAQWGNEGDVYNETYFDNFQEPDQYVWVLAEKDLIVWPVEGEHWGGMDPDSPYTDPVPMEEMRWYNEDLFGLRTADENGMNNFESFDGVHTGWSDEDLEYWLETYFTYI